MDKVKTSTNWRRKGRAIALQTLFEVDCTGHELKEISDRLLESHSLPEGITAFSQELVSRVLANKQEIDDVIQRFAPVWPFDQMTIIDRNILRLGICEILFDGVPMKVAINEAVELAKVFGSESSPRFVNGVLGSVYTEIATKKIN